MKKVQISIDEELLKKIDEAAAAHYTNRSAYISITLAKELLKTDKAKEEVKNEK